jgi:hypothetical protein
VEPAPGWRVGDVVELRKPHACGGRRWRVYRVGADVGLRCESCNRRVLLARADFERRVKGGGKQPAARP